MKLKRPHLIVTHSKTVLRIAKEHSWLIGARYTNLRDVKTFSKIDFIDIDWKDYNYKKHLDCVKSIRPLLTVARDIEKKSSLEKTLDQAEELSNYCKHVIVVPKDIRLAREMESIIPKQYIFGYSVPTKYGGTQIPLQYFKRPVHLLGGRPDVQRKISEVLDVFSLDCNRFTLDAKFGDYFDGEIFRPHKEGGYINCINDSIKNINKMWHGR
jgi:hypothetical protein